MNRLFVWLAIMLPAIFCRAQVQSSTIDLSGVWHTSLGECRLPGTTDENKLGGPRAMSGSTAQLTRLYPYKGQVTYERDFNLTSAEAKCLLRLSLERTKPSTLWLDGDSIGHIGHLFAPHVYTLPKLSPGTHHLKLVIDNSDSAVPQGVHGSHAWTDATQTNWNGILGRMEIIATPPTYIADVQLYPDVVRKEVAVRIKVAADKKIKGKLTLKRSSYAGEDENLLTTVLDRQFRVGENTIEVNIPMGEHPRLWSEFHPDLYRLDVTLHTKQGVDCQTHRFGMREVATEGTQFVINGYKTFLRGTHDGCVFPLTAYAPTDVNEWRRLFSIGKQYGLNHFRFHSYTPTEAAFQAADELGVYLHTELPLWGSINADTPEQNEFMRHEAFSILQFLGNHPSFTGLGLGNELNGDASLMRAWLDDFREADHRHLYCMGANNDLGWKGPKEGEDLYITCRVGGGEGFSTHARASFSFADADHGGILNWLRPNTQMDFSNVVPLAGKPIVSHETAQFQIYPDYKDIPKYTGVLYPYNLETFRSRLAENGLTAQIDEFHQATGRWAVECYKADMEMCMRTPEFGGFQLLDIKDYPGQGTALVGILDAFMETKGLVTSDTFRGWNSPVTPFALLSAHCFETTDTLKADIALCNYTEEDYSQPLEWTIADTDRHVYAQGTIGQVEVRQGQVIKVGKICLPLNCVHHTTQLYLTLSTGSSHNYYKLWAYVPQQTPLATGVIEADTLSADVVKALEQGQTVLLTPSLKSIEKQSVGGLFTPDYWNYAMFKTISENNHRPVSPGTLGMLMNPEHPLFDGFPTEGHTDWQWWCVALNSRPLILNSLAHDYRPLIQTVDNIERNHKLGILMELRVGRGKLLLSTTNLESIAVYPEGRAYINSLKTYASSPDFNPLYEVSVQQLRHLLYSETQTKVIQGVRNITDYQQQ